MQNISYDVPSEGLKRLSTAVPLCKKHKLILLQNRKSRIITYKYKKGEYGFSYAITPIDHELVNNECSVCNNSLSAQHIENIHLNGLNFRDYYTKEMSIWTSHISNCQFQNKSNISFAWSSVDNNLFLNHTDNLYLESTTSSNNVVENSNIGTLTVLGGDMIDWKFKNCFIEHVYLRHAYFYNNDFNNCVIKQTQIENSHILDCPTFKQG